MSQLLKQLKKRRLLLGLKQKDMMLRIGVSRQQYQQIESKGNPRLSTLELIAKGLKSELMLIPAEKLDIVNAVLENDDFDSSVIKSSSDNMIAEKTLANNPWENILKDME